MNSWRDQRAPRSGVKPLLHSRYVLVISLCVTPDKGTTRISDAF